MTRNPTRPVNLKSRIKRPVTAFVLLGLLFGAYGGFGWTAAWIFLALSTAAKTVFALSLKRKDPELVRRRQEIQAGTKGWDKVWLTLFSFSFLAMLAIAGLDAGRFHWSSVPLWGMALGGVGYLLSMLYTFSAMAANTHFEGTVRIQTDRNHKVVDNGPYGHIRHPGYAALIVTMLSIPALLGSLAAFIPAGAIAVLFVVRTVLEDRTLRAELSGYSEYTRTVRYRLIPGVW